MAAACCAAFAFLDKWCRDRGHSPVLKSEISDYSRGAQAMAEPASLQLTAMQCGGSPIIRFDFTVVVRAKID
jgi:hypothetical protein